jgi:hypothetical protein
MEEIMQGDRLGKRILWLAAWLQIAGNIVELATFCYVKPDWWLDYMLRKTKRKKPLGGDNA